MKVQIIILSIVLLVFTSVPLLAQDEETPSFPLESIYAKRKPWGLRPLLKNIKFSASLGYGRTYFRHNLTGLGVFQRGGYSPRIFPNGNTVTPVYTNWINKVTTDQLTVSPDSYLVTSDTAKLGFKNNALNIPLHVTIHYEFKNFRIGAGYGYELMSMGTFEPKTLQNKIAGFRPDSPTGLMKKYYGFAGYSFYRWNDILFSGMLQIGGYKPGRNFDMSLISKSLNFNVGILSERELSEYIKAFVKPSVEFKSYTIGVPNSSVKHNLNAFYLQLGLTYSIPELPRCFLKDCRVQMNHAHGNREYRSRVHPFYKKQNPNYGENHPRLVKDKWKNRRKLNPY